MTSNGTRTCVPLSSLFGCHISMRCDILDAFSGVVRIVCIYYGVLAS